MDIERLFLEYQEQKERNIELVSELVERDRQLEEAYQKIDKLERDYINLILKFKSEPIKGVFKIH